MSVEVKSFNEDKKNERISAVKMVRKKEKYYWERGIFCKEHNMKLEELLCRKMEEECRDISQKLEDILNTGYVNIPFDD